MIVKAVLWLSILCCAAQAQTVGKFKIEVNTLDGDWQFRTAAESEWRTIKVPGSWEAQFPDLRNYSGRAYYRTRFRGAREWQGKAVILKFGAVDWQAKVSVNGKPVGTHDGGYTPFQFEIQDYVSTGLNQLDVEVIDVGPGRPAESLDFREIPHGKQSWYGTNSGIWQSVRLEARDLHYFALIRVTPNIEAKTAVVRATLKRPIAGGRVTVSVKSPTGSIIRKPVDFKDSRDRFEMPVALKRIMLWSPDNPSLYTATVRLERGGKLVEEQTVRFGMRKLEARDGMVYLNGRPIFLIGALDQDFYPLTEYAAPFDEFIKDQFEKAKHMGLNTLRCHIKVPDPRYLDWADRLGLLVWYEIPNGDVLSNAFKTHARAILEGMIERDYNHPSLAVISIINEGWGIDSSNPSHRAYQREMYDYAKKLDPSRLIVDNSACGGNFHVKTDIEDYHAYFSIPDHSRGFDGWIAEFAERPGWTFSPQGDCERRGWEPLVLSEFGNWGLPKISLLKQGYAGEPWWFATGSGPTHPAGAEQRFYDQGLDKVFGTYDALAEASQDQEWIALKYQIEQMRKHPSIVGYMITEFTDLHWESNGLLDMCRNPKVFHDRLPLVQAQDVIIPDWREVNYRSGSQFAMDVLLSHFSGKNLAGSRLKWQLEGFDLSGEFYQLKVPEHTTSKLGTIEFTVPDVESPKRVALRLQHYSYDGKLAAENYQDINIFPRPKPRSGRIVVWDRSTLLGDLPERLRSAGYEVLDLGARDAVLISGSLDQRTRDHVEAGGSVILLIRGHEAVPRLTRGEISVKPRDHNGWWGDWCSSFIWFRKGGPLRNVPLGGNYDFEFHRMIPNWVITGMEGREDADDVLSGIFVGWVHNPGAIVCQFKAGEGRVLATTLDLSPAYGDDPAATQLLDDMIEYAASPDFQPSKEVGLAAYTPPEMTFVSTAEYQPYEWRYTTAQPDYGWEKPGFDESGWRAGKSGFGTTGTPNAIIGTTWNTPDIWLRTMGTIDRKVKRAVIRFYHDEDFEVYLNGKLIFQRQGFVTSYDEAELGPEALNAFRQGRNTLAIHCRQTLGGQFVDFGLWYDMERNGD